MAESKWKIIKNDDNYRVIDVETNESICVCNSEKYALQIAYSSILREENIELKAECKEWKDGWMKQHRELESIKNPF